VQQQFFFFFSFIPSPLFLRSASCRLCPTVGRAVHFSIVLDRAGESPGHLPPQNIDRDPNPSESQAQGQGCKPTSLDPGRAAERDKPGAWMAFVPFHAPADPERQRTEPNDISVVAVKRCFFKRSFFFARVRRCVCRYPPPTHRERSDSSEATGRRDRALARRRFGVWLTGLGLITKPTGPGRRDLVVRVCIRAHGGHVHRLCHAVACYRLSCHRLWGWVRIRTSRCGGLSF
jgi:hypothetical protein